ncbi:MAG: tail fiber protein [Chitinophagaceae bacterium]
MYPLLGEIKAFAGNYAPVGWLTCDGSLQQISQFESLYSLLGTTYGGDGQTTFGLPDLRGRLIVQTGQMTGAANYPLGVAGGLEKVVLTLPAIPSHNHSFTVSTQPATTNQASGNFLAAAKDTGNPSVNVLEHLPFKSEDNTLKTVALHPGTLTSQGGNQPHENRQPYLCITYMIATEGEYPSFQ